MTPKQIAAEITKTKGLSIADLGLRFDRVVMRLMDDLEAFAGKSVPQGTTVLLGLTAPIRLAGKTESALEEKIEKALSRKAASRDLTVKIHGNRARIRIIKHGSARAAKFIGFVHNPDSNSKRLLDLVAEIAIP